MFEIFNILRVFSIIGIVLLALIVGIITAAFVFRIISAVLPVINERLPIIRKFGIAFIIVIAAVSVISIAGPYAYHLIETTPEVAPAPSTPVAPVASGIDILKSKCTTCHSLEAVYSQKKSIAEWQTTIKNMKGYGVKLTPEEEAILLRSCEESCG